MILRLSLIGLFILSKQLIQWLVAQIIGIVYVLGFVQLSITIVTLVLPVINEIVLSWAIFVGALRHREGLVVAHLGIVIIYILSGVKML